MKIFSAFFICPFKNYSYICSVQHSHRQASEPANFYLQAYFMSARSLQYSGYLTPCGALMRPQPSGTQQSTFSNGQQ